MADDSKDFSVSKVVEYSSQYSQNMKNSMSVLNFNQTWQNRFSEFEGAVRYLRKTKVAIDKGLIDLTDVPENKKHLIKLDLDDYYYLNQIWRGGCFITRKRHPVFHGTFIKGSEFFHFDDNEIDRTDRFLEVIPVPAFEKLTPIGRVKDDTLLIQTSAEVPLYLAYEKMQYDTLIREGGLYHYENGNLLAKFSPDQMNSKSITTYKLGRSYYFNLMGLLKNVFMDIWDRLEVDLHFIMVYKELTEQIYDAGMFNELTARNIPNPPRKGPEDDEIPYNHENDMPPSILIKKDETLKRFDSKPTLENIIDLSESDRELIKNAMMTKNNVKQEEVPNV